MRLNQSTYYKDLSLFNSLTLETQKKAESRLTLEHRGYKTRKWTCSDLCTFFHFHPRNRRKKKPTNFSPEVHVRALAAQISRKIVSLFDNSMPAQNSLLIKFCQRKTVKVYDYALVVRSLMMLQTGQTALCCFITRLQSHTCTCMLLCNS